ncbi:MAG: polysaccharide export protein [Bacteroidales bacterium]|nr:polysaccharide export protein [Bacteroidales bacterium]
MKNLKLLFVLGTLIVASSCTSYKRVPYIQNSESLDTTRATELYDARIQPKDMLTITVSCKDINAAIPFNLTIQTTQSASVTTRTTTTQPALQTYIVDNNGGISFPTLGYIIVGGMTRGELENYIKESISPHFTSEEPIVTVRFINYKISVLGEVSKPNSYTISNERVNIFEALALAGDLTIYGKRDGVKLLREDAQGKKKVVTLDLNDANIIYSPYYHLQQNDIIYVEPNKAKAQSSEIGSATSLWFSAISIMISVVNLFANLLR